MVVVKKTPQKSQDSDEDFESSDSCEETGKHPNKKNKPPYKFMGYWKEDHDLELFGVSVNQHIGPEVVFATAGSNRVTVYEVMGDTVKLCQCYVDPEADENFYTCAWSYNKATGYPVLAAAGKRGIIRLFSPADMTCFGNLVGHGNSVNELRFHPGDPTLLLSVSKDHALRLWNIKTGHNIAIFGGVEGHRDEVLSADFDMAGTKIVSSGMDHSLKIWRLDSEEVKTAIEKSYKHDVAQTGKPFPTEICHFPDFSTRDIHKNYVDCCRWFGNLILSKSCENAIICWKPGTDEETAEEGKEIKANEICEFRYNNGSENNSIWFLRFSMDQAMETLAIGNSKGVTYVWDLTGEDPTVMQPNKLTHPKCKAIVRQTGLSRDGSIIICVCDDATIWRWDRKTDAD